MTWWDRLLGRPQPRRAVDPGVSNDELHERLAPNDMRIAPVDNPMDQRPDGSIREGDPAWDVMNNLMKNGGGYIAHGTQRPDGTWDVKHTRMGG